MMKQLIINSSRQSIVTIPVFAFHSPLIILLAKLYFDSLCRACHEVFEISLMREEQLRADAPQL